MKDTCLHADFDEYFGKCPDCDATRQEVIVDEFKDELQKVYGKLQEVLGIDSGDIDPLTHVELETAEDALADEVVSWLESRLEV